MAFCFVGLYPSFICVFVPDFTSNIFWRSKKFFCYDYSQYENRRPLPKFGEWDVNDPGSADGFTVIFNKARDEKKCGGGSSKSILKDDDRRENVEHKYPKKVYKF